MRVIKFRGMRTDNGEWVYGMPAYNRDCTGIDKIEEPMMSGGICKLVDPETVGQYVGRKDDDGNDIWEGSSLKVTITNYSTGYIIAEKTVRVEFRDGVFGFEWGHRDEFTTFADFNKAVTRFEVVDPAQSDVSET